MNAVLDDPTWDAATRGFPPVVRVRFELEALEPGRLPAYAGSAWRGLLGHSLRRTVCVTRQSTCHGCLLTGTCAYSVFFESPPPNPQSARRYTALPHPFVLDVAARAEREVAAGETLRLGLNLIGPAGELLPYLIHAVERAGQRGIGRVGGRFALNAVLAEQGLGGGAWQKVYDAASGQYRRLASEGGSIGSAPDGAVRVEFLTPLRVKRRGRFVGAREFGPEILLQNLVMRLSSLAAFYGGCGDHFDWSRLAPAARDVSSASLSLRWSEWTRFSSRQNTTCLLYTSDAADERVRV